MCTKNGNFIISPHPHSLFSLCLSKQNNHLYMQCGPVKASVRWNVFCNYFATHTRKTYNFSFCNNNNNNCDNDCMANPWHKTSLLLLYFIPHCQGRWVIDCFFFINKKILFRHMWHCWCQFFLKFIGCF